MSRRRRCGGVDDEQRNAQAVIGSRNKPDDHMILKGQLKNFWQVLFSTPHTPAATSLPHFLYNFLFFPFTLDNAFRCWYVPHFQQYFEKRR